MISEKERQFKSVYDPDRKYRYYRGTLSSESIFGQVDADVEWKENRESSSKIFVHTSSYEMFVKPDNLFVFGRRGTGKTALIQMLDYEVKKGKLSKLYNYSRIITQEDTLPGLTMQLRNNGSKLSRSERLYILKQKLVWVIYNTAMLSVIEAFSGQDHEDKSLKIIINYLKSQNIFNKTIKSPLVKVLNVLSDNFAQINYDATKAGLALMKSIRELYSPDYDTALEALVDFLKGREENCVILIDSQDLYEFNDDISETSVSALIDATIQIHNESHVHNIHAKVAFPSEIRPHLNITNEGKSGQYENYILWRYTDLLKFIAKRYDAILRASGHKSSFKPNGDFLLFLGEHIPQKTLSSCGVEFETIPYILSHTQKKPRELITLFNNILNLAKDNEISFEKLNSDCIREGTNARIEYLSKAVVGIYKNIYSDAQKVIAKTLFGSKNILTCGELHSRLTEANSILYPVGEMTKEDAERLFLETGIIGIIQSERDNFYQSKSLIQATFEYQLKDTLTLQGTTWLAIHPMFYQSLHSLVDQDSIIYPKPSLEEEQELIHMMAGR